MEIFQYLKKIYHGKNVLFNHISLFSLLGVMTIVLNNYASSVIGSVYGAYFGFPPINNVELYIDIIVGLMLFIFFTGYCYKFVNSLYNDAEGIPDLSLSSYTVFVKMFPLFIMWGLYILTLSMAGLVFFRIDTLSFYIYYSIIICLLPFVKLIFVIFAKDFKFNSELYNPLMLFKVLDKSLGDVIFLSIEALILSILPCVIVYLFFHYSNIIENPSVKLGLRLGGFCFGVYFFNIIKYIYSIGLVKIAKSKFGKF